eukprot:GHVO01061055.1.p1 GENE.GHVO01061055.1~~GHVO01061055.1.p1  ORF type:complete len:102 (+),score=4.43 GHVO01061055.1:207-512(+)
MEKLGSDDETITSDFDEIRGSRWFCPLDLKAAIGACKAAIGACPHSSTGESPAFMLRPSREVSVSRRQGKIVKTYEGRNSIPAPNGATSACVSAPLFAETS